MKIMVFDVPAESGGALSVLKDFYNEYKVDENNEYIFVVSKPELEGTKNIKVLRYPWIKNSWLHRIYFDNFIAPKIIKTHDVDEVLSLQNVIIPHTKVKQKVYVHNSLPFAEYRFKFLENKLLWVYQNIISKSIFKSIKKANKVIVQTKWMKRACIEILKVNGNKIEVMAPKVNVNVRQYYKQSKESMSTFFYPASGVEFKNHKVIVEACMELKKEGIKDYKVIFTLKGNENRNIQDLYKRVKKFDLPIYFVGNITRDKVFDHYSKSILIFPSYIETVGLPLIEARMHGTPILTSNCVFSHEILDGYEYRYFFNPFDTNKLYNLISSIVKDSNEI
ncbi:glycosyltransferase [Clostridium sulfidigenes]|uniref:glycosyltransferase n=1 Tax=Clostridium sulfidigenes TaxID=318464 RepID=UPI003F8B058D